MNIFDLHLCKAMVPLLRISSSQAASPVLLVQYWLNICKFVYTDRLDTLEAKDKCNKLILTTAQQHVLLYHQTIFMMMLLNIPCRSWQA